MKCVLNKVSVQLLPRTVFWGLTACPRGVCLLAADRADLGRTALHDAQVFCPPHFPTSVHALLLLEWSLGLGEPLA